MVVVVGKNYECDCYIITDVLKMHFDCYLQPKTVNAFQRVKIDQVEFKDDRLKDNSYWAKV